MAVVEYVARTLPGGGEFVEIVDENPTGNRTRVYGLRCNNTSSVAVRLFGQHPQFPGGSRELVLQPGESGELTLDMPASSPVGTGFSYGMGQV